MAARLSAIFQSLVTGLLACTAIAKSGIFNTANIEVGFHHYAEIVDPITTLKMPYNALVNIGYITVGVYWMIRIRNENHKLPAQDVYFFDVFSMMSILYAPVQFFRIITQNRTFAILDQWVTLPIFAWAGIWGMHAQKPNIVKGMEISALLPSIMSYFLINFSNMGFEIALGLHIILVVIVALSCQWNLGKSASLCYMLLAILSCIGFVVLKINDLELGKSHWFFKRISGHFLSKICDIMQIDLVARFFLAILQNKLHERKK